MITPESDMTEPRGIRIRHPLECMPRRPERKPVWSPPLRNRGASRPPTPDVPERHGVHLAADALLGAVRVNFRFASWHGVSAAFSEKAKRAQFFESPHEAYGYRRDEIDPTRLDLQYQPIALRWTTRAGTRQEIVFDWAVEMQDGSIVVGEDKASEEYFDDPRLSERLDFAEQYLETCGASLERRVAGGLPTRLARRAVKDAYDARRTAFHESTARRVRTMIRNVGGTARLADVLAAIGNHPDRSLDVARAMMHHRLISMPIASMPMPDTPVTIPVPATKGRLRAFLAAHVPVGIAEA